MCSDLWFWNPRSDSNPRPSIYESDVRRRSGWLKTIWPAHVVCAVGPDGFRRIQRDRLDDHWDEKSASDRNQMARQAVLGLTSLAHGRHLRQGHVLWRFGATLARHDHLIITLLVPWRPPDPEVGTPWSGGGRVDVLTEEGSWGCGCSRRWPTTGE